MPRLFFDFCLRSLRFRRLSSFSKVFSSKSTGPIEAIFCGPYLGRGNESLFTGVGVI